jgi:hypothetical protein
MVSPRHDRHSLLEALKEGEARCLKKQPRMAFIALADLFIGLLKFLFLCAVSYRLNPRHFQCKPPALV